MTAYDMPKDPKHDVWDRDGYKWTYDTASGLYNCKERDVINLQWYKLLYAYGPLTDTKIPEVGETITVVSGDLLSAESVPEDAVFINGKVAAVRVRDVFKFSGCNNIKCDLYPGEWTRLR